MVARLARKGKGDVAMKRLAVGISEAFGALLLNLDWDQIWCTTRGALKEAQRNESLEH